MFWILFFYENQFQCIVIYCTSLALYYAFVLLFISYDRINMSSVRFIEARWFNPYSRYEFLCVAFLLLSWPIMPQPFVLTAAVSEVNCIVQCCCCFIYVCTCVLHVWYVMCRKRFSMPHNFIIISSDSGYCSRLK